jgi:hypothetical protein
MPVCVFVCVLGWVIHDLIHVVYGGNRTGLIFALAWVLVGATAFMSRSGARRRFTEHSEEIRIALLQGTKTT